MINHTNPWVARFIPLLDENEIRERARVAPPPLENIQLLPSQIGASLVDKSLSSIFLPSQQVCTILKRFIELAMGHNMLRYPDQIGAIEGIYNFKKTMPQIYCLTGLAGVGKTELLSSLERILPEDTAIDLPFGHDAIPLKSLWHIKIKQKNGEIQLLSHFLNIEEKQMRRQLTSLTDRTERRAHRDGISLLTADECQFFTQSANANTAISKALLLLGSLGVPFIFCSNYSLGHKLKDRPQEERQRLLCSPIVLLPDHHESEDWRDYLAECKRVAGDWLDIDVINDAASIHHYSFGLKRLVVRLIVIAYRHMAESGEKKIKLAQIQRAYLSTDYSVNRVDVETLIRISINSTTSAKEKHLLCPFDLPPTVQAALSEQSRKARDALVTKRYVESSMTAEERSASNIAKKKDIDADNAVPPKPKSPTRRKTVLTQESLRAGFDSFMNEITPGKRKPV